MFKTGYGQDTVMHFENGLDVIDVRGWKALDDFYDVEDHMSSSNGDVLITVGNDVLRLSDTSEGDLDMNDFMF